MATVAIPTLAAHRVMAGLSQRQLAKIAGVNYQTIRSLESGGNAAELPLGVLAQITDALDIGLADLLTDAHITTAELAPIERLTLAQSRLLRKVATKATAAATLSKAERELTLPGLLKAGLVVADTAGLHLHADVAAALVP